MSVIDHNETALDRLGYKLRWHWARMPERAAEHGIPPSWTGWRGVAAETVPEYFARRSGLGKDLAGRYETVHPASVAQNPLPRNVDDPERLPADRGWWGYSFRDVPCRESGETFIATLPDCRVLAYQDPQTREFYPAILNQDERSLSLREVKFRPPHRDAARSRRPPVRMDKATWFLERVYDNHSHWLTAHLPKLCLLKARGELEGLILPASRTATMDATLRMLEIDPRDHPIHDPSRPLEVGEMTLIGTDRFRPELLRPVRDALAISPGRPPWRKLLISREGAARRRLLNEDALWPVLQDFGFEKTRMETLSFEEQVRLMGETAVLLAPHGAGLTNMIFCPEGAHVVELADLTFPNPNFYGLASAMGHAYWLIESEGVGEVHPLEKDLRVDVERVREVLERIGL